MSTQAKYFLKIINAQTGSIYVEPHIDEIGACARGLHHEFQSLNSCPDGGDIMMVEHLGVVLCWKRRYRTVSAWSHWNWKLSSHHSLQKHIRRIYEHIRNPQ